MLTQALNRNAQVRAEKLATVAAGRARTWSQLRRDVAKLAAAISSMGVGPGDRVGLLGANSDRYLEASLAVAWVGAVLVPLNTRWSAAELEYALTDAGASLLIVDESFADAGRAAGDRVKLAQTPVVTPASDLPDLVHAAEACEPLPDARLSGQALAGIYYTGGTTGRPKGVMVTPLGLWTSAVAFAAEAGIRDDARYLHAAPMFHLADVALSLATTIAGGVHHFLPAFDPQALASRVAEDRISHLLLVPTMLRMLLQDPGCAGADLTSLQCLAYGASPIDDTTLVAAMARLPGCAFIQGYGQSELSPLISVLPPERHVVVGPLAGKLRSAGRASACVELEVVDPEGRSLPVGAVGEVRVRGPGVMLGYWKRPEETAAVLREGWVYTGDAGYLDADGLLFLVDRLKDMIVSGGENVFSAEVENALASHPAVAQCAVIGVPDPRWGERVQGIVVLRPGRAATEAELITWCRERIAPYKAPRSITFRAEALPLSAAGKVLKRELRAPFWDGRERAIG